MSEFLESGKRMFMCSKFGTYWSKNLFLAVGVWGPGTRTPKNNPGLRYQPVFMVPGVPVPRNPWTWMSPLAIHPLRHADAPSVLVWAHPTGCAAGWCLSLLRPVAGVSCLFVWAVHTHRLGLIRFLLETTGNCIFVIDAGNLPCVGGFELGLTR